MVIGNPTVAAEITHETTGAKNASLAQQLAECSSDLEAQIRKTAKVRADFDAFAYSVSHDLKEPLRALEAFSQFLVADYGDKLDEDGQEFLHRIAAGSQRMKSQIEDLLAVSRVGRMPVSVCRIDMDKLVRGVVDNMHSALADRSATVEIVGALPAVSGEEQRLQQAFGQLISNGIKFNQQASRLVTVCAVLSSHDALEFHVSDNGIGIDSEYYERVFEIFQRVHAREEYDGNGAGLAIAKHAVESLGGSIRIDVSGSSGTTFVVTLPPASEGS